MSIEGLYAGDIEAGIRRDLAQPPRVAPPSFSTWGMLSSGAKGIPAAELEVGASALDLLSGAPAEAARRKGFGRQPGGIFENQPEHRFDDPADYRIGASVARQAANSFYPDPETSHVADQTLFGLTRVITKAVPALAAGGPVGGAALLGSEETNTQYRALIAKGIDPDTALKVAGVQGAITGASVGLPMVGSTVAKTLGLMAVTGPGAYVAQETLSRNILEKAGYHDEASLHNPTDPLGLTMSIVLPAIFGGVHIAGLAKRPTPVVARTEAEIKGAVALTPAEQAASDAFERSAGNLAELRTAIEKEKNPANKAILQAELEKLTTTGAKAAEKDVIARAAFDTDSVDAARVRVTNDALARSMPDHPEAAAEVMRAHDEIAAGEMPDVEPMPTLHIEPFETFAARELAGRAPETEARAGRDDFLGFLRGIGGVQYAQLGDITGEKGVRLNRGAVFKKNGRELDDVASLAVEAGYLHPDALTAADDNGGTRAVAELIRRSMAGERIAPYTDAFASRAAAAAEDGRARHLENRLSALGVDASHARGDADVMQRYLDQHGERLANERFAAITEETRAEAADIVRNVGLTQDMVDMPAKIAIARRLDPEGVARASAQAKEPVDFLARIEEILDHAPDRSETPRGGAFARADGGVGKGDARPNALPPADQVAIEPATRPAAAKAVQAPEAQRAAALAEESPDLKVQLPGSEQTLTVSEALKQATEQHKEDASFADLAKAALDCALGFGA